MIQIFAVECNKHSSQNQYSFRVVNETRSNKEIVHSLVVRSAVCLLSRVRVVKGLTDVAVDGLLKELDGVALVDGRGGACECDLLRHSLVVVDALWANSMTNFGVTQSPAI